MSQRQPFADATATLGTVHTKPEGRDAVHLACFQVTLGGSFGYDKGDMLFINTDGLAYATKDKEKALGILDPFIENPYNLSKGDKVWLILFPGMITSLRHVWEHPSFPNVPSELPFPEELSEENNNDVAEYISEERAQSLEYLKKVASDLHISVERLMSEALEQATTGNHYYIGRDEAEGYYLSEVFWRHYETYTATKVKEEHKQNFISCSC